MLTIYWLASIGIIMPVVGLMAYRARRRAEMGLSSTWMYFFSTILGVYLVRNAYLLIDSGGWASQLVAVDNLPVTALLANGIVDLTMNLLLVIAICLHMRWEDKIDKKVANRNSICATLESLDVEPEALVELRKIPDLEIHVKIQLRNTKPKGNGQPIIVQELDHLDKTTIKTWLSGQKAGLN